MMNEGSSMMYHGSGGYGGAPMFMVPSGPTERGARQYPLEMLQYMGGLVERGAKPGPLDVSGRPQHPASKADNTAFGYESDDSSLSSNASGSNKSSDKGDNTSHTSEMSIGSSSSSALAYNKSYYDNNNNNAYNNNNNGFNNSNYHSSSREWRGRRREVARPRRIAPDRYLNSNYPFQVKFTPDDLLNGSKWDTLSQEIWDKFVKAQQTEETFRKKMTLWRYLYVTIKSIFPRYGLYVVGSTMSGFALDRSDVDLCLHARADPAGPAPGAPQTPRDAALLHLGLVLQLVKGIDSNAELIQAKVPILKFGDARLGLTVDLNCNNVVGLRNTNLLYCYSRLDWRVRPLVVATKLWAAAHDINDARRRTLASYPLTLMVIHFLQCGVSPPVLPVLGRGGRRAPNKMSLGELFVRLLHYYAHFPYGRLAVSVRLGRALPAWELRAARPPRHDRDLHWKLICVEEPFDLSNTARSVYDPETFEKIVEAFRQSYSRLSTGLRLEDAWPSEPR